MKLYTIGHSNRSWEDFCVILHAHHIVQLIDIRTIPRSRHVPWTNKDNLKRALGKEKIAYHHLPSLGGLRHTHQDSINNGWKNKSFRGFADYMQTNEFYAALKSLNQLIKENGVTVIMCAEAVPWRCHRSLIADAEIIRHVKVLHILSATNVKEHALTSFASVDKHTRPYKIYYPAK